MLVSEKNNALWEGLSLSVIGCPVVQICLWVWVNFGARILQFPEVYMYLTDLHSHMSGWLIV
jgi:hypothetical protein